VGEGGGGGGGGEEGGGGRGVHGVTLKYGIWNPESGIRNPKSGIRNPVILYKI